MTTRAFLGSIERALDNGPVSLDVGIGGGGRAFVAWLCRALSFGSGGVPKRTPRGLEWEFQEWRVIDGASSPPQGGFRADLGRIRIERCAHHGDSFAVSMTAPLEVAPEFLRAEGGAEAAGVATFVDKFGALTSIADVTGWAEAISSNDRPGYIRRVEGFVRNSESFRAHFRDLQTLGGARLLDLGRVIYLLAPEPMHLGDEWASLASANSNRTYSLADINLALSEFADLFLLDSSSEVPTVAATNPFVRMLFSGFVPASSSEYLEIFRWMSARAVASLLRPDSSDSFIRSSLPVVAARGGCLPALLEDGAIMLSADVGRLSEYLERDPLLIVEPGAKALLLHAHRLRPDTVNREAQMELALRRMSLTVEADRIAEALPERSWRPVWSSTSPTNVHRILSEDVAGVLSISVVPGQSPIRAYAGLGNGRIRLLRGDGSRLLDTGEDGSQAEIRGFAALNLAGTDFVVAAASDATIRAFRIDQPATGVKGELLWTRSEPLASPLTTAAIWVSPLGSPVVLSGGVSGTVWRHDLVTGAELEPLIQWGAEIRSIRIVEVPGRSIAVVAAVDGRIGLVDLAEGTMLTSGTLSEWAQFDVHTMLTPSSMDAVRDGDRIRMLIGCAMGELFEAAWSVEEGLTMSVLSLAGTPPSGVNEVNLVASRGHLKRYIARNDGVWLRYDPDDVRQVKVFVGHAGPVLSQAILRSPDTAEVISLTGGSEGTVRIWRHVEVVDESLSYLRVNRHRGAIRAVEVKAENDSVVVVTGGDDGDVRVWNGADASRGRIVSQHQGHVTSFLWLPTSSGLKLVVGAADGTLRLAPVEDRQEPARLLGIAHEGVTALASRVADGMFWSAGNDGGITLWDALAGVARGSKVVCRYGKVTAMVTDSRGHVYVGGQDGTLSVIDPDSLEILSSRNFDSAVVTLDEIPGLHLLVLGLASGRVSTLDISHSANDITRDLFQHELGSVAVKVLELHGQVAVVSVGRDRKLIVIDVNSRAVLHEIGLEGFPTDLAASENFIAVSTTAGATLFEFSDGHLFSTTGRRPR